MKKYEVNFKIEDRENIPMDKVEIACRLMEIFNISGHSKVRDVKIKDIN